MPTIQEVSPEIQSGFKTIIEMLTQIDDKVTKGVSGCVVCLVVLSDCLCVWLWCLSGCVV